MSDDKAVVTTSTTEASSATASFVDLPLSHAAIQILAGGNTSYATFSGEARRLDLKDYICARSLEWEICLVWSDGILAVVPFGHHTAVAKIHAVGLSDPVHVPLDTDHPVGLASSGSPATAIILDRMGTEIGRAAIMGGVVPANP